MAEQLAITVPYGVVPGQQMKATTPDGRCFMLTVPRESPRAFDGGPRTPRARAAVPCAV